MLTLLFIQYHHPRFQARMSSKCAKRYLIGTRVIDMTTRERALVAVPSGKYGTIQVQFVSGASGGNFWHATYCTRGLLVMI